MIYFDNAATTFPKPHNVRAAVTNAVASLGGNPGRSGHAMSMRAAAAVYTVREKAAALFGAQPENVIFTSNCTHSINFAVKGLLLPLMAEGETHVIMTDIEHNSVARPLWELSKQGLVCDAAHVYDRDEDTLAEIKSLMTDKTKAVICTLGSNVTGRVIPFREIGMLCRERGICFIADGAQVCGVLPVNLTESGINILCCPGHKGLYGITGTGLLITDGKYPLYHIMEGGTGSTSAELDQTPFLPDMLESGTLNLVGIVSVGAGIDFIRRVGMDKIHEHESALCDMFIKGLWDTEGVTVYRSEGENYLPIVLFNVDGSAPEETAADLDRRGFALRGGLQCSPLAHTSLGTFPSGGVRFAPSYFNTRGQTAALIAAVKEIAVYRK